MLTPFKLSPIVIYGIIAYMSIAFASTTGSSGGGGSPLPPCNELTTNITIRINWGAIQNYQYRDPGCDLPSQMSSLPWSQTANPPNQNNLSKAIVVVLIKPAGAQTCKWAKTYETRQYHVQPGIDDVIAEVPRESVIIALSYYEACTNCTTISANDSRALFTSETLVPQSNIFSGALVALNIPVFVNAASCN